MANKNQRRIQLFDLSVKTTSRKKNSHPNQIGVKQALDLMLQQDPSTWEKSIINNKIRFYCSDFSIEQHTDGDIYQYLINVSNCTLSDPIFSGLNGGSKTRRIVEKDQSLQEGQDFSSHIIIKLPSNQDNDLHTASMLIESADGLSIIYIIKFFNHVLKQIRSIDLSSFQQLDPSGALDNNGNQLKINVNYNFEYRIPPNQNVKDIINSSKIKSIQLIDEREIATPLDQNSYFVENKKILELKISDNLNTNRRKWEILKNLLSSHNEQYQKCSLILSQDETKPAKKIDLEMTGNLINTLTESYYIHSQTDLASSYEHFCDPILSKMKELLES